MLVTAGELFSDLPIPERTVEAPAPCAPRVLMPNRIQVELRPSDLESLLSDDHTARLVWGFVERQDLSTLFASIKAVDGGPGRDAIARRFCFRCGCTRRWRAWAAPALCRGCARHTMPTAGCAAGCG